jgi:hypothetical protein
MRPVVNAGRKRSYKKPSLKKLTLEQAKLLLIGHFSIGTEGASDLLSVLFPDPGYVQPERKTDLIPQAERMLPG